MKKEIKIGLLTIIALFLALWGYNFLTGTNLFSGDRTFYTVVDNAKQINTATKVLINGYQVGSVTSISPDPNDVRIIKIAFQVKKEIELPDYTTVEIRSESPIGGKEIELIFDKFCDGNNCASNGAVFELSLIHI